MSSNGSWNDTEAGKKLMDRLNSEKTLKSLDYLLDRIDTLEAAVEKLTTMLDQGPGMVSMMADTVDEEYRRAAERGVDINERLKTAMQIAERLTDPAMLAKFDSLLKIAEQAPGLASMVADMADEEYRRAAQRGVDVDARLKAALHMAEKLTAPAMLEKLENVLQITEQLPGLTAMSMDILDEGIRNAAKQGLDIDQLASKGLPALIKFSKLVASEDFEALMDSGILETDTIKLIGNAAEALRISSEKPAKKVGPMGMIGALGNSDRKRAIGFLMEFAKQFGKKIE